MELFDLFRYKDAQRGVFSIVIKQIREGKNIGNRVLFVFPEIKGASKDNLTQCYALSSFDEACAFLEDEMLGKNLIGACLLLLDANKDKFDKIIGWDEKSHLQRSMTLFKRVRPNIDVFQKVLDKFYDGRDDDRTIKILEGRVDPKEAERWW